MDMLGLSNVLLAAAVVVVLSPLACVNVLGAGVWIHALARVWALGQAFTLQSRLCL